MKPTEDQITLLRKAWHHEDTIDEGLEAVVEKWESIRPPCPDCGDELEKAKADIAELNQRLHERTQAFLGMAGRARG